MCFAPSCATLLGVLPHQPQTGWKPVLQGANQSRAAACSANPLPAPPGPTIPARLSRIPYSPDPRAPAGSSGRTKPSAAAPRRAAAISSAEKFHRSPDAPGCCPSNRQAESSATRIPRPARESESPRPQADFSGSNPPTAASRRSKKFSAAATPAPNARAPGRAPWRSR